MRSNIMRNHVVLGTVFACLMAALLVFAVACTSEDAEEKPERPPETGGSVEKETSKPPAEIVRNYLNVMLAEDPDAMADLMTQKAREASESFEHRVTVQGENADFEVSSAEIEGDRALVPVTLNLPDGQPPELHMTYRLRREDGRWGIYAVTTRLEDGSEFTVNYEQMGEMGRAMEKAVGQKAPGADHAHQAAAQQDRYEALQPVTSEAFKDRWQMDLSADARPAGELLAELLAPMGLVPPANCPGDLLATPITLDVTVGSRLQLIERVCEALGHYPEYPMTKEMKDDLLGGFGGAFVKQAGRMFESPEAASPANALILKKGPRRFPAVFSGPLMIEIADMTQNAAYATGSLSLRIYGTDVGKNGFDMIKEADDLLKTEKITGPDGSNLFHRMGTGFAVKPYGSGTFFRIDRNIILKNLLRQVTQIDALTGEVAFSLPTTLEKGKVRLDTKGTEKTVSLANLDITARQNDNSIIFQFNGSADLLQDMIVRFNPEDTAGLPIFITSSGYSFMGGRADYQLSLPRPAQTVAFKVAARRAHMRYPFSLQAVALPKAEAMPAALAPLKFPGQDKPVAIELTEIDRSDPTFSKARLHVLNHTNKAIARIDARFVYLDEAGAVLKEFPHTLEGTNTDTGQEPFIAADTAAEKTVTAFFMPEQTKDIAFRIEEIAFMDTTTWRP